MASSLQLASRALILAKLETTYGSDPTPTKADNAFVTSMLSVEITGSSKVRDVVLPTFGRLNLLPIGESVKITFSTELRGSAVPTSKPALRTMLLACNMSESDYDNPSGGAVEGTQYKPNSEIVDPTAPTTNKSITIYAWLHNLLYKVNGCVGTFTLDFKAGDYCKINWEFTGLWGGVSTFVFSGAIPTDPTFSEDSYKPLRFINAGLSITPESEAEIELCVESFTFDIGNTISNRVCANSSSGNAGFFIGQREPKGTINPEVNGDLTVFNPYDLWENGLDKEVELEFELSDGASPTEHKVKILIPRAQLDVPKHGSRNELRTYDLAFNACIGSDLLTSNIGDDEISIIYTTA